MKGVIDYCTQDKKVFDRQSGRGLVGGVNCNGKNAFTEFMATKGAYKKTDGINFYQYVQSFSPEESVTAEKAHEVALELSLIHILLYMPPFPCMHQTLLFR